MIKAKVMAEEMLKLGQQVVIEEIPAVMNDRHGANVALLAPHPTEPASARASYARSWCCA